MLLKGQQLLIGEREREPDAHGVVVVQTDTSGRRGREPSPVGPGNGDIRLDLAQRGAVQAGRQQLGGDGEPVHVEAGREADPGGVDADLRVLVDVELKHNGPSCLAG